jgi:lipopolysaccharide/colanic/teichoic acid biosynthesis glycosyltransferase
MRNIVKRGADFILSSIGLLIFAPVFLLIILAVLMEDGRPVFFMQERVGKSARRIKLIKFRTMKYNGLQPHLFIDMLDSDPRTTKAGRILRATAMDELPQLINIIKGDMSFVGPKPLPYRIEDEEKTKYQYLDQVPGYGERIKMLPGLTGIAQIFAPKTASREEKFRFDNMYLQKQSLFYDIKLILISFFITLNAKWESREKL